MAVTPHSDIMAVTDMIITDPYILSLGFSRSKTYNTMNVDELLEKNQRQIFIYFAQGSDSNSSISVNMELEIDISVPLAEASKARLAAEQIIAILQDKRINGHMALKLSAPSPCNLSCQYGFEVIGVRFKYPATVYNVRKTVTQTV